MSYTKYKPAICKDGIFYKVKPYIIRVTNLEQVPQYEMISYKSYIYKISSGDTPTTESSFITSDNYILVTANNEYFVSAGG